MTARSIAEKTASVIEQRPESHVREEQVDEGEDAEDEERIERDPDRATAVDHEPSHERELRGDEDREDEHGEQRLALSGPQCGMDGLLLGHG